MTALGDKARKYALKLLSYRGRSEKELRERLSKKGISEPMINSTLRHLKKTGLVNDMLLAEFLKGQAINTKMLSQASARNYVLGRGISREVVATVFGKDNSSDSVTAGRFIEKKQRSLRNYPPEVIRRRLYQLLSRRGYSYQTISEVLKNTRIEEET